MAGNDNDIGSVIERWFAALEGGDAGSAVRELTDDVVWMPPEGPTVEGRGNVESVLDGFLRSFAEEVSFEIVEIVSDGDLGFARVLERTTIRPKDEKGAFAVGGRHLFLLRRDADGVWRISHQMSAVEGGAELAGPEDA